MSGSALILHIAQGSEHASEMIRALSPTLSTAVHRAVSDAASLDAVLHEQAWSAVLCEKHESDYTLHSFLDSLPGMALQIRMDKQGVPHFPYVSEGSLDLLGIAPSELELDPQRFLGCLHPEDAESFRLSMLKSASRETPWNWEGRIVLRPEREIKWVNLRAKFRKTDSHGTLWKGFMVNITQNKLAEIELKQSRQRQRELSSHIESIKEEERTRIAREIHDEIGVLLTALKMDLAWLTQRLPKKNSALHEKTRGMANLLDTAGRAANDLVHSLRPGSLDCFGIVATIEIEAGEFTKRTGIPCKIIKSSDDLDVPDEQSITLFRIFQETLNNIMKHAAASQVQIQILGNREPDEAGEKYVELVVSDDGCGFEETARNKPRSFGLRGIQERISQLGGKVSITSSPGKGCTVAVHLPLLERP